MKRVLFIHTGGTLGMSPNPHGGPLRPGPLDPDLLGRIPELSEVAEVDLHILMSKDSSNLVPSDWETIGAHITEHLDTYDGVVVLHGTDTMVFTASALSFMFRELDRPIILTGSQRPLGSVPTDARQNIVHACMFATFDIPEVAVLFGAQLFRGNRTTKLAVSNYRAFASPNCPPLAEVGVDVRRWPHIRPGGGLPCLRPGFGEEVAQLPLFPGFDGKIIRALVDSGIRGIVLQGFGAGNLPMGRGVPEAVRAAVDQGVVVAVQSQCLQGRAQLGLYEGGQAALDAGAISGGDMTAEASVVKLMYLLGQGLTPSTVRRLFCRNLAGELTTDEISTPMEVEGLLNPSQDA